MKFYKFGNPEKPVIMLLPGTCCFWRANFGEVIPLLARDFNVVCVSYDGFDEKDRGIFPDMITETIKIEQYILDNFDGRICCAYGSSLGGSFVGLLVQRGNVHIYHAILGSSDLDQDDGFSAKFKAWLIGKFFFRIFQEGKLPKFMEKRLEKKPAEERKYYDKMLYMFGMNNTHMAFVKRQSIQNQFYSDLIAPLEDDIFMPDTIVHIFYAVKMGDKYLERYNKHFKTPDIRRHNMQHEELLICYPSRWVNEVKKCCGLESEPNGQFK